MTAGNTTAPEQVDDTPPPSGGHALIAVTAAAVLLLPGAPFLAFDLLWHANPTGNYAPWCVLLAVPTAVAGFLAGLLVHGHVVTRHQKRLYWSAARSARDRDKRQYAEVRKVVAGYAGHAGSAQ